MSVQGRLIRILLIAPIFFVAMVVVHEIGHAYAVTETRLAGARIVIWPGYELYPDFGASYSASWPGKSIAFTQVVPLSRSLAFPISQPGVMREPHVIFEKLAEQESMIVLMGVGATTTVSLLSLCSILLLRPKGLFLWVLSAGSLMHIDAFAYTIFPVFLGAPHFLFWGGSVSEPITSLTKLGLPQTFTVSMIMTLSFLQFAALYWLLSRSENRALVTGLQGYKSP